MSDSAQRPNFWPAVLCIVIAFVGGFIFAQFHLPLAYMLGAIAFTMVAGMAGVTKDAPPFSMVAGDRARRVGINSVGLRRRGFSAEDVSRINSLRRALLPTPERDARHRILTYV